mgnify:CR=1 FL=1
MKSTLLHADLKQTSWFSGWNRFWFTPADPTLLGLIRICCGLITLYTMIVYSFRLQDFMGEHGWQDLQIRLKQVYDEPRVIDNLNWTGLVIQPATDEEREYNEAYFKKWGSGPPLPYTANREAQRLVDDFMEMTQHARAKELTRGMKEADAREYIKEFVRRMPATDPRVNGARAPETATEYKYAVAYYLKHGVPPAVYPDFTQSPEDLADAERYIDEYYDAYRRDPNTVYARGLPVWSIWFDVTDPAAMALVHGLVVLVVFLFTIGFCTRITAALTWMTCLWYIHRTPVALFGVDSMQTIVLLYLMIGPAGAALSVDRLIARWWSKNKLRVVNAWRGFWKKPALDAGRLVPASYSPTPAPSISANVAYRLLQIHTCIIYLIAGLAKLQGSAWWQGTAVWGTLSNFEFAPMQFGVYMWVLKQIVAVQWIFYILLTLATYFTLAFEIAYVFLIWAPRTRWWLLGGAIILHGFIGLFMGLKTFSLMMLVMNMSFLTLAETRWLLARLGVTFPIEPRKPVAPGDRPADAEVPHTDRTTVVAPATGIKESAGAKMNR